MSERWQKTFMCIIWFAIIALVMVKFIQLADCINNSDSLNISHFPKNTSYYSSNENTESQGCTEIQGSSEEYCGN